MADHVSKGRPESVPTGDAAESTRNVRPLVPPTDIYETADALVLALEMPGVGADSVYVSLDKRVLTITGQSAHHEPSDFALVHAEYRDGTYERAFTLSEAVDGARINASMKDGVLQLTLPKAQPAKAKTIPVSTG
jgi:HSP20 family molecular chaperone IbpA